LAVVAVELEIVVLGGTEDLVVEVLDVLRREKDWVQLDKEMMVA
jgi:hypothetical protein